MTLTGETSPDGVTVSGPSGVCIGDALSAYVSSFDGDSSGYAQMTAPSGWTPVGGVGNMGVFETTVTSGKSS